jgi:hypothetical protein
MTSAGVSLRIPAALWKLLLMSADIPAAAHRTPPPSTARIRAYSAETVPDLLLTNLIILRLESPEYFPPHSSLQTVCQGRKATFTH